MESKESKTNLDPSSNTKSPKQTGQHPHDNRHGVSIDELLTKQANSALLYLLFYSILMFTLPFVAFFGTQHVLRDHTELPEFTITSLSVTSSVISVYVIIGLYAYRAFTEKEIIITERSKQTSKKLK